MKLFEHADFRDAVIAAREHFASLGLTEQFIEKDYRHYYDLFCLAKQSDSLKRIASALVENIFQIMTHQKR